MTNSNKYKTIILYVICMAVSHEANMKLAYRKNDIIKNVCVETAPFEDQHVEGVGYIKTQLSCILFIMLTTTCFGHCGCLQVTKMYTEENYTEYDHSTRAYSKLSTRSRRKIKICTCTMIILCIGFLYIHFCDLKMAHSGRNMSSA